MKVAELVHKLEIYPRVREHLTQGESLETINDRDGILAFDVVTAGATALNFRTTGYMSSTVETLGLSCTENCRVVVYYHLPGEQPYDRYDDGKDRGNLGLLIDHLNHKMSVPANQGISVKPTIDAVLVSWWLETRRFQRMITRHTLYLIGQPLERT